MLNVWYYELELNIMRNFYKYIFTQWYHIFANSYFSVITSSILINYHQFSIFSCDLSKDGYITRVHHAWNNSSSGDTLWCTSHFINKTHAQRNL